VTDAAAIDGFSPVWDDRVWLARGKQSRLYPVIRDFLREIEASAASVTVDLLNEFRRPIQFRLWKHRLKSLLYSLCGHAKRHKYNDRIADERRAIRDAAFALGTRDVPRGPLSDIMDRHGSDKASGAHNYALYYERLLGGDRDRVARVFEIGIGSTNPDAPFNMGAEGVPGASLRGWRDYFEKAAVFGGDIDEGCLFEEARIKTAAVDQTRPESIGRIFRQFGDQFDLIIDDGYHQIDANRTLFENAFRQLKSGGLYIIEDVLSRRRDGYKAFLAGYDAAILDIPHPANYADNCLAIVVKNEEVRP
jgi:SAM-dependent methyltransferase